MTPDAGRDERVTAEADISVGREIRRAREVRGISLQHVAQETKINERYLHALENDRLDLLPGQPYTSNFVRAIARTIGADEEELLDYLNYQLKMQQPRGEEAETRRATAERGRPLMGIVLAIGAILVVSLIVMTLRGGDDGDAPARATAAPRQAVLPTAPAATSAAPEASAPIVPTESAPRTLPILGARPVEATVAAPTAASAPAASAPEGPVPELRLTFREPSYVEIVKQGSTEAPTYGIKEAGAVLTYTLDQPLSITINNAGGVSLSVDGQPGKPLGGSRESRTLVVDRRNYRSFLR